MQPFYWFWWNLASWRTLPPYSGLSVKISTFWKSKMAAAAILKITKIAISLQWFYRSLRNLVWCCRKNENDIPIKDDSRWKLSQELKGKLATFFVWKWPVVKYKHIKIKPRICILFISCLTWTVNANSLKQNIIVIKQICSWLPPYCKQNLLVFMQPRWQLWTYLFNHYNVLF